MAYIESKGYYVLAKRFTSKEERRRVVAAVFDPTRVASGPVAFENHLNYYQAYGSGLPVTVAKGLAAFPNSTLADSYFRQFSGHTQVNAADLRSLRNPGSNTLVALGRRIGKSFPPQEELDRLIEEIIARGCGLLSRSVRRRRSLTTGGPGGWAGADA